MTVPATNNKYNRRRLRLQWTMMVTATVMDSDGDCNGWRQQWMATTTAMDSDGDYDGGRRMVVVMDGDGQQL